MATLELATDNLAGNRLYAAWRFERAKWDAVEYAPRPKDDPLPDEIGNAHCAATAMALNDYLLHPAANLLALATKLEVFRDEQIWDSWIRAEEITACLARDARRLAERD